MDGASIIAFVQVGLQVCNGLWSFYNTWKDYREDIAFICDSLAGIEEILTFLQESMAKRPPKDISGESCQNAVQRCTSTMDRLRKKLGKIQDGNSSSGFQLHARFQWERVKYPLKESTILKLRDILQETKSDLILLLAALQFESSSIASSQRAYLSDKMDELSSNMVNINTYMADFQEWKNDIEHKSILDRICKIDPSIKHGTIDTKREPGTCNWLFRKIEFQKWKTHGSILWIRDAVGCGKSVICSAAVEHMKLYCTTTPKTLLLYFYFSFADQSKQSTAICLSSLLRQLCVDTSIMAMLEQLHKRFAKDKNPEGMDFKDVQIYLQAAIAGLKGKKEVYVIMDALDELLDDREGLQRAQMLKWITETSSRETHVHILFTSRMDSSCMDIEKVMKSQSRLFQVSIDTMTNRDDIQLYLEGQFRAYSNLNKLKTIAQVNIIDRLIEKSDGMFQWVSCQLDELKDLQIARSKDVEEVLNSMPPTLDECYMRILQGVSSRFQPEIVKALNWISLSFQPLSLEEVNEACIIDPTESPAIKKEDQFSGDGITTLLPSFEFFKSSTIQDSEYSKYGFRESGVHASIAESCIAYIYYYSSCPMRLGTQSDLEYFPLLFYACRYWFEHLRLAEEEQKRLAPFVIKFLNSWKVHHNALRIYNPLFPENRSPCKIHTLASPLGWAAALGLEYLAEQLLKEDSKSIDAIQDIRCFTQEHEEAAELAKHPSIEFMCELCDNDELLVLQCENPVRGTALMKAVVHGHENLAWLLIKNGANIHVQEKGYEMKIESALSIACDKGNENMVCLLLQGGADPNENCGGRSALDRAIRAQSKSICEILLTKKAHVNESDSAQNSPLMIAAFKENPDLCNLLLDYGADINWRKEDDAEGLIDALSIATRNGSVELVDLFLSRGSHIRPEALFGSLCAINMMEDLPSDASRYKRVCELLINCGADLNPASEALDTPLAMALHIEWYDIAELMLKEGAQVHPDDSSCLTAGNILVAAIKSLDMTEKVLDLGVDVNAQVAFVEPFAEGYNYGYRHFSSALQAAAFHHNRDVVELLLQRNADPGITGPPYGSALYAVVGRIVSDQFVSSDELSVAQQICEMLLAKGAEWDRKYGPEDEERMAECRLGYRGLTEWQKGNIPLNTPLQLTNGGNIWFQIHS